MKKVPLKIYCQTLISHITLLHSTETGKNRLEISPQQKVSIKTMLQTLLERRKEKG